MIAVGVLGPLDLRVEGAQVPVRGRRERCLLAVLAVRAGRVVSASTLIEHLWGDEPPRTASKGLQMAVANVRSTLRQAGNGESVETTGAGYRLAVTPDAVDLGRFEDLAADGRAALGAGSPGTAAPSLGRALALWRGDMPADLGDGVAAAVETQRLIELRLEVLADRVEADLQCGRHHELVAELGALCDTWPLRERFQQQLMLSLHRSGRQADALSAYQRLRKVLVEQLGLEPSEPVQALERRILAGDPRLHDVVSGPGPGDDRPQPAPAPPEPVRTGTTPRVRLIGRDDTVDEVAALVGARRLVTLVGPGGVGKTALAEHLAGRTRLPLVWARLGALDSAERLVPALATAADVQQAVGVTMRQAVKESLGAAPTLLVLDNCEHLLDDVAALVSELLDACAPLAILATSRERLGVQGEVVWPVEGLPVPGPDIPPGPGLAACPSVTLFVERARESDPHFAVDETALRSVAAICRRLDGLPLALELAAARIRALPLPEIAKRLDHRFDLLVGGRRPAVERHRTLRATVAWSHELLAERERRLFRRLSAFAGPFTLDDAEAVGSLGDLPATEVAALLADLVDKSMVTVNRDRPGWHYRLLETLREYGREQLVAAGEADAVDGRLIEHHRHLVAGLAVAVTGPREAEAVARIQTAFDNLRGVVAGARRRSEAAALAELIGGLAPYLRFHVRWEASAWAEEALGWFATLPAGHAPRSGPVAGIAAWGMWFAGDLERAEAVIEQALAAGDGDQPGMIEILTAKSLVLMYRQEPSATEVAEQALALAEREGMDWDAVYLLGQLAITHAYRGRPDRSEPYLARQERLVEALGNGSARAWWLYCRAEVSGERDPAETVRLAREAIGPATAASSNLLENIARITALTVAARHGDAAALLDDFALLIERFRRDGAWTHLAVIVWNLVEALARIDALEPAAVLLHAEPVGAPTPYGEQLARLQAVEARLAERMPAGALAAAAEAGARLSREQIAQYALDALLGLGARRPEPTARGVA